MPALNGSPAHYGCSQTNVLPDGGDWGGEAGAEGDGGDDAEEPGEEEARVGHRAGEGGAGAKGSGRARGSWFFLTETE